jgi:peptide/nickel transport system permease protein
LTSYIVRRLLQTIVVLIVVIFLAFFFIHLTPGDPVLAMIGDQASPQQVEALRHQLYLDQPLINQFGHWCYNAIHGNFGNSITYKTPVFGLIKTRLVITGYLSIIALILSTLTGIAAGTFCAIRRGSFLDQIISLLSNVGVAVPVFWLAMLSMYFFSLKLHWLPVQGWVSPTDDFLLSIKYSIMPIILLAIPSLAIVARQTRSSMLEVIHQDYIRTAFSKGLKEQVIILRHAIKNALIPIITLLGLQARLLVSGSVLVETVFNIPGMGRLLVNAALTKDFLIIQGGVLVLGIVVCLVNLLVDISYGFIDPRVKYS